jgi:hypothetical protein
MQVKVKNISQREEIFEVNLEDKVSVLASLVKERFNYENNVKLIYIGKVLIHDNIMSSYFSEHINIVLICLEDKNKVNIKVDNKVDNIEVDNIEVKDKLELRNVRSILYAFFTLISNDTALNYLFFNNPESINSLLKNGHLDDMIIQFINQSDKISDILESGINESIDIELTPELKINVLGAILSESNILEGFIKK